MQGGRQVDFEFENYSIHYEILTHPIKDYKPPVSILLITVRLVAFVFTHNIEL